MSEIHFESKSQLTLLDITFHVTWCENKCASNN
jgi:hypothetical protein